MTIVTYKKKENVILAFLIDQRLYPFQYLHKAFPAVAEEYLKNNEALHVFAKMIDSGLKAGKMKEEYPYDLRDKVTEIEVIFCEGMDEI